MCRPLEPWCGRGPRGQRRRPKRLTPDAAFWQRVGRDAAHGGLPYAHCARALGHSDHACLRPLSIRRGTFGPISPPPPPLSPSDQRRPAAPSPQSAGCSPLCCSCAASKQSCGTAQRRHAGTPSPRLQMAQRQDGVEIGQRRRGGWSWNWVAARSAGGERGARGAEAGSAGHTAACGACTARAAWLWGAAPAAACARPTAHLSAACQRAGS